MVAAGGRRSGTAIAARANASTPPLSGHRQPSTARPPTNRVRRRRDQPANCPSPGWWPASGPSAGTAGTPRSARPPASAEHIGSGPGQDVPPVLVRCGVSDPISADHPMVGPHRGAAEPGPVGNNLAGASTAPWPACWTMSMSASRPADDPNAAATFVHGGLGFTPECRPNVGVAIAQLRLDCATFRGFCHPSSHLW